MNDALKPNLTQACTAAWQSRSSNNALCATWLRYGDIDRARDYANRAGADQLEWSWLLRADR